MRIGSATSWSTKRNPSSRMCSMLAREPLTRLSTQMTRRPRSSRYSQRCEPRKPAPPVTSAVGTRRCYLSGPLPQVLVRLHVEPHREQRELEARDDEERDEDHGRDRNRVTGDPVADDDEPEQHARDRRNEPHHVEEDERMEVPLHVLLPEPPEEAPYEQPRDPRHDVAVTHVRALAHSVDRTRRNVTDARVPDVEVDEHVVREAVVRVDVVEVELLQHLPRDDRVARLRVGDMPVAGRDLRQ